MIGNCQGSAVATGLRLLLPDSEVVYLSAHGIARRYPRMADLVREFSAYDVVFAGSFAAAFRDGGDFETLRAGVNVVQMPVILFSAFHPDVVYVGDIGDASGRSFVRGPIGTYHSALTLYGFRQGFAPDQTLRLFTEEVYRLVGYLGIWPDAQATLLRLGQDAGFDLAPYLLRWSRRGCFMHLVNHPKMYVANDLARGLLGKAGIPHTDCDLDSYAADEIVRLGSWPVYPAIAAQFGLAGNHVFLQPARKGEPTRTIGLGGLIEASYAAFAAKKPAELKSERVDAWIATPELVAALRVHAGG